QQIYSFLHNVNSQVLGEMRNEATADEILARIKKLRERELTATDQRALDLFEALIERKSAEVLNQPAPHVSASAGALTRALDRRWAEGEPRLRASSPRNLGTMPKPELIDEQLRELRPLVATAPAASRDHLRMTDDLVNLLFWSYS